MTLVEADPEVRQVPVVILTPSREEQDLTRCYRLGRNCLRRQTARLSEIPGLVRQLAVFWAMLNEPPPA